MQAMHGEAICPSHLSCANMAPVSAPSDPSRLVSTTQAAKVLGVSQSTLSRWAKAGHIKPTQKTVGGHMRWDVEDLRRQVEKITG